ncbi:MAG: CaiB/BaiF CoA transferase family protein [Candidatus Binatia bacterium]
MTKILEGIRLVEVADWGFVPSAAAVIGDWGADVIKIEHPVHGDPLRGLITSGMIPGATGINFLMAQVARNKKSVGLDLNREEGRQILYRLVERADIFLTNFLPSARAKLRIEYDDIRRVNPRIIYAKGHGQGQKGPDADKGGYDGCSFWSRGAVGNRLTPAGEPPITQRPAFGDFISGMFVAGGIAGALYHRERTGKGSEVDVSLLGAACWVMSPDIVAANTYGFELPPAMRGMVPNPLVNNYQTKDGKYVTLMMLQFERFWPIFCKTIGKEEWLSDDRYATAEKRKQATPWLVDEIAAVMKTRDRAEWEAVLRASDCIWAPVNSPLEVGDDPQVVANGYLIDYDYGQGNRTRVCASPVQFDNERVALRSRAPEAGEHTEEVLLEAGYTWEDIGRWKEAGVIS